MASAWEQAAEIQQVNQRMRQLQLSMAVGESLHARHLSRLTEEMTLRFASPAFGRLRMPAGARSGRTHADRDHAGTSLPVPATRAAMRRIGRQRGPMTRRIAAQGFDAVGRGRPGWRASTSTTRPAGSAAARRSCRPASRRCRPSTRSSTRSGTRGFPIAAENQPLPPLPAVDPLPPAWDYPGHFRTAAADHLVARSGLRRQRVVHPAHHDERAPVGVVREQMHPRVALANLVARRRLDGRQRAAADRAGRRRRSAPRR